MLGSHVRKPPSIVEMPLLRLDLKTTGIDAALSIAGVEQHTFIMQNIVENS